MEVGHENILNHQSYMLQAKEVALIQFEGSTVPTKGAVIVNSKGEKIGEGRAKMPCSGLFNESLEFYERQFYVCHAELRAIISVFKTDRDVENCVLYCTHYPCTNCAKLIIQSGIKKIYYNKLNGRDNFEHFNEFNIEIIQLE